MNHIENKEIALDYILRFTGQWYKWGGETPAGIDCCLTGDTLIQTDEGFKKIKDFKGGESVLSIFNGDIVSNKVINIYNNGIKDLYRLKTNCSTIDCTENHKFLVVSKDPSLKGWSVIKSMKLEWKCLKDLKVKDFILMSTNQNIKETINFSSEKLKFLGAMLGDGHIHPDRNGFSLAFYEKDHREEFVKYLIKGFGYSNKVTEHPTHGLTFHCTKTTKEILSLGICICKSPERKLPNWVFKLTNEQLKDFVYGYFFADGYRIDRKKENRTEKGAMIDSSSYPLVRELHDLLLIRGFHVSNMTQLKRTKPIFIKGKEIKKPTPSHRFCLWDSPIKLYPCRLYQNTSKKNKNTPHKTLKISESFRFQTVKSIQKIDQNETFDLTIENSHNYFANGFVVHNSGLAIEFLKASGLVPRKYENNAQGLFNFYAKHKVIKPYRGCLVFWQNANKQIIHVEIMLNDELSIGASGGGSKTLTVSDAIRDNAFVKVRAIKTRDGIAGFVDPFLDI